MAICQKWCPELPPGEIRHGTLRKEVLLRRSSAGYFHSGAAGEYLHSFGGAFAIQVQDPLRRGAAGCGPGLEFPRELAAAAHQAPWGPGAGHDWLVDVGGFKQASIDGHVNQLYF